jgi:hypothetical protein
MAAPPSQSLRADRTNQLRAYSGVVATSAVACLMTLIDSIA